MHARRVLGVVFSFFLSSFGLSLMVHSLGSSGFFSITSLFSRRFKEFDI
jgi:hypothetical protein